jgi:hypothetical protein
MSTILEKVAQRYAFSHYGNLVLVDEPEFDESEKLYVSNLRSDYPLIIQDDRLPEKRTIRVLKIGNLGTIFINSDKKIVKEKTSSREDIVANLNTFFELWKERAERIVISASSDNLVRISRFRHFFDPIDSVLIYLWDNHKIFDEEIKIARLITRRKKMKLYLNLLEGLEIVRRVEDGYVEGNQFLSMRDETKNEEQFRDAVVSHIIRERYPTLRDVFHLTILEPTIHIDNSIYLPELETEQTVYRIANSIERDYRYYYERRINPLDLKLTLKRLENAEAISRRGNHYSGNKQLLKKMIKLKKSMPELGGEFSIRA